MDPYSNLGGGTPAAVGGVVLLYEQAHKRR